jgi:hypothetical protein
MSYSSKRALIGRTQMNIAGMRVRQLCGLYPEMHGFARCNIVEWNVQSSTRPILATNFMSKTFL